MTQWRTVSTAPGVWDVSWVDSVGGRDHVLVASVESAPTSWLNRSDVVFASERTSRALAWAAVDEILARLPGCTAAVAVARAGEHVLKTRRGTTAVLLGCRDFPSRRPPARPYASPCPGFCLPAAIAAMRADTRSAFGSSATA